MNENIKVVDQLLKIVKLEQIKSTNGTNVCEKRNVEKYFELC